MFYYRRHGNMTLAWHSSDPENTMYTKWWIFLLLKWKYTLTHGYKFDRVPSE